MLRIFHSDFEYLHDLSKDVLYDINHYRKLLHRVGHYAGLRHMAKNGVPIQVAMLAHCGKLPSTMRPL